MSENNLSGSTARNPDLDWSQIRETILMLALSIAQIEMSMRDSDGSVEVLSNSFTSMMGQVKMIERVAAALPETVEVASAKVAIIDSCTTVSEMMRSAIMAFQFYDKLTQRLGHVNGSMSVLGDLIADQRRLYNPYEWMGMQDANRFLCRVQIHRRSAYSCVDGHVDDPPRRGRASQDVRRFGQTQHDRPH
jgi:hypothetical protein